MQKKSFLLHYIEAMKKAWIFKKENTDKCDYMTKTSAWQKHHKSSPEPNDKLGQNICYCKEANLPN